jgi:hypothetical protein
MRNPFVIAEEYIQLRKKCVPKTWADAILRFNELVVAPFVLLFLVFSGSLDIFMAVSSLSKLYESWREWISYNNLRFDVQSMFLRTMVVGGPFIRTNDPDYMPYVFADAVMRTEPRSPEAPSH